MAGGERNDLDLGSLDVLLRGGGSQWPGEFIMA